MVLTFRTFNRVTSCINIHTLTNTFSTFHRVALAIYRRYCLRAGPHTTVSWVPPIKQWVDDTTCWSWGAVGGIGLGNLSLWRNCSGKKDNILDNHKINCTFVFISGRQQIFRGDVVRYLGIFFNSCTGKKYTCNCVNISNNSGFLILDAESSS